MPPQFKASVTCAVEGDIDAAIARKLLAEAGGTIAQVYGLRGKSHLERQIQGFNNAARFSPWLVLVDLDMDAACAPPFRQKWLPDPASQMCFRVAVREVEAWLLADRERLARFLQVSPARVLKEPEQSERPKEEMVKIAGRSRSRAIREDMVPRYRSGRAIGPAYTSRLVEFVEHVWNPSTAERASPSLARCRRRIPELVMKVRLSS